MGCVSVAVSGLTEALAPCTARVQRALSDSPYTIRRKHGDLKDVQLTVTLTTHDNNSNSGSGSRISKPSSATATKSSPSTRGDVNGLGSERFVMAPVFRLFVVSVTEEAFEPKQACFQDWYSALSDSEVGTAALLIIPADRSKLGKVQERAKSYYNYSNKAFDAKTLVLIENKKSSIDEFIQNLRILISESISSSLRDLELKLNHLNETGSLKNWTVAGYLQSVDYLAFLYQSLNLSGLIIEVYKSVDTNLDAVLRHHHSKKPVAWLQASIDCKSWKGTCIVRGASMPPSAADGVIPYTQLRNYVFSRRFLVMMKLSELSQVLAMATNFVLKLISQIGKFQLLEPEEKDCWQFVTCVDLIDYLKDTCNVNVFDFPAECGLLFDLARLSLQRLGCSLGLYALKGQSAQQMDQALTLMAGVDQSDEAAASVTLRQSLSSKPNYNTQLLLLFEMALSCYKHRGWLRFARVIASQLGDYYLANAQGNLAEKYFWEAAESFLQHKNRVLELEMRTKLFMCNSSSDVSAILTASISDNLSKESKESAFNSLLQISDAQNIRNSLVFSVTSSRYIYSSLRKELQNSTKFQLNIHSKLHFQVGASITCRFVSNCKNYLHSFIRGNRSLVFSESRSLLESAAESSQLSRPSPSLSGIPAATEEPVAELIEAYSNELKTLINPGDNELEIDILFHTDGFYILKWVDICVGNIKIRPDVPFPKLEYQVNNLAPIVSLKDERSRVFARVSCQFTFVVRVHSTAVPSLSLALVSSETLSVVLGERGLHLGDPVEISSDGNSVVYEVMVWAWCLEESSAYHSVLFQWNMNELVVHSYCQIAAQRTFKPVLTTVPQSKLLMMSMENLTPKKITIQQLRASIEVSTAPPAMQSKNESESHILTISQSKSSKKRSASSRSRSPSPISENMVVRDLTLNGLTLPVTLFARHSLKAAVASPLIPVDQVTDVKVFVTFRDSEAPREQAEDVFWTRQVPVKRPSSGNLLLKKTIKPVDAGPLCVDSPCQLSFSLAPERGEKLPSGLEYVIDSSQPNWLVSQVIQGPIVNSKDINVTVFPRKVSANLPLPSIVVINTSSSPAVVASVLDTCQFQTVEVLPRKLSQDQKTASIVSSFLADS